MYINMCLFHFQIPLSISSNFLYLLSSYIRKNLNFKFNSSNFEQIRVEPILEIWRKFKRYSNREAIRSRYSNRIIYLKTTRSTIFDSYKSLYETKTLSLIINSLHISNSRPLSTYMYNILLPSCHVTEK